MRRTQESRPLFAVALFAVDLNKREFRYTFTQTVLILLGTLFLSLSL